MYSVVCAYKLKFNLVGRHYNHKRTDRSELHYYFQHSVHSIRLQKWVILYLSGNMYPPTNVLKRQYYICY